MEVGLQRRCPASHEQRPDRRTFALKPSSLVVDAGFAGSAIADQRCSPPIMNYPGVSEAGGHNSDIGSFELAAALRAAR